MEADPATFVAAALPRDRDVGRAGYLCEQTPERSGTPVAQKGTRAAGHDGGHPPCFVVEGGISDRIDAAMNAMQSPCLDSTTHVIASESNRDKLS